jgi:hypothetical protein
VTDREEFEAVHSDPQQLPLSSQSLEANWSPINSAAKLVKAAEDQGDSEEEDEEKENEEEKQGRSSRKERIPEEEKRGGEGEDEEEDEDEDVVMEEPESDPEVCGRLNSNFFQIG